MRPRGGAAKMGQAPARVRDMKTPVKSLQPHQPGDPPAAVLSTLRERGAAILIDENRRPTGVLTFSDMGRLRRVAPNATRAEELFEPGRKIYAVAEGEEPLEVARAIALYGLKTGITMVNSAGTYVGYVFVDDLRNVGESVRLERQEAEKNLSKLREEHPEPYQRAERIFRSGSGES